MKKFKAIFFDVDDTLVDHKECEKQALQNIFTKIGVPYENRFQEVFRPIEKRLWYDRTKTLEEIVLGRFEELFTALNIPNTDYAAANEYFVEGLAKTRVLFADAYDVVSYLHGKGYKLGVVTNGLSILQKQRILDTPIGKFIDDIIVSEESGVPKPHPKIFQLLLKRMKLKNTEVIMVGDMLDKDIRGAHSAGMKAVWINRKNKPNESEIIPEYEVKTLSDLKEIF